MWNIWCSYLKKVCPVPGWILPWTSSLRLPGVHQENSGKQLHDSITLCGAVKVALNINEIFKVLKKVSPKTFLRYLKQFIDLPQEAWHQIRSQGVQYLLSWFFSCKVCGLSENIYSGKRLKNQNHQLTHQITTKSLNTLSHVLHFHLSGIEQMLPSTSPSRELWKQKLKCGCVFITLSKTQSLFSYNSLCLKLTLICVLENTDDVKACNVDVLPLIKH